MGSTTPSSTISRSWRSSANRSASRWGADWLQEVDLHTLLQDVGEYVQTCMAPEQARHLIDRAMRTAISSRTVAVIIVPVDVQHADAQEPPRAHGSVFSSAGLGRPQPPAEPEQLRRAADVLNAGKRVAILIGQGAAGAADEVIETADRLGGGVAKALNGRAALPDDLPFVTGPIGLLGSKPRDILKHTVRARRADLGSA